MLYFEQTNLHYFTSHPKSEEPTKAVIRCLPTDTPAEGISNALVALGFSVISDRHMATNRPVRHGGSQIINRPLFLITVTRNEKSQEIIQLFSGSHIIKVEAYRARAGLTQCFNCPRFDHLWTNRKQPPRCLWCGGSNLHKHCLDEDNERSTPNCCNVRWKMERNLAVLVTEAAAL